MLSREYHQIFFFTQTVNF